VRNLGFHAFRRYVASILGDKHKASRKSIQKLLRHKKEATTERYLYQIHSDLKDMVGMGVPEDFSSRSVETGVLSYKSSKSLQISSKNWFANFRCLDLKSFNLSGLIESWYMMAHLGSPFCCWKNDKSIDFKSLADGKAYSVFDINKFLRYSQYERNRYAVALEPLRPMDLPLRCCFFLWCIFKFVGYLSLYLKWRIWIFYPTASFMPKLRLCSYCFINNPAPV